METLGYQLFALLIHNHLEGLYAASVINLIDILLFLPANPNLVKALQSQFQLVHSESTILSSYTAQQWDSAMFSSHILSTPTWSLASSYSKQESCLAEVVFEQYDQEISAAHPNQQITANLGLCSNVIFSWRSCSNIPSCLNKIDPPTDRLVCAGSKAFLKYLSNYPQHLIMTPWIVVAEYLLTHIK